MRVSKVTLYCKLPTCPSSELLVSLVGDTLDAAAEAGVTKHLRTCDFCSAEFQLLALHSTDLESENVAVEMPKNLKLLAESILSGPSRSFSTFFGRRLETLPVSITKQ